MDRDEAPTVEASERLEEALQPVREQRAWIVHPALLKRLEGCAALSAPPATIGFLAGSDDRDMDLDKLTSILNADQALVGRLIQLANSALFGRRRNTENIRQVFIRMGLSGTVNMALSLSLVDIYRQETDRVLLRRRHWLRSLAAAVAAHTLASHLTRDQAGTAFLAALTQDIGMIVLACAAPELYEALDPKCLLDREWARAAELDWYRCHHGEVGAWLLGQWGFPPMLQNAVANAPRVAGVKRKAAADEDFLTRCVALSGVLADTWIGLDSNAADNSRRAAAMARNLFDLKPAQIGPILSSVSALTPDLSSVFGLVETDGASPAKRLRSTLLPIRTLESINQHAESEASLVAPDQSADSVVASEFDRAHRHGWPLSVARIQIERGGDADVSAAAMEVARKIIIHTVRPSDMVAQRGEGEFVVVMPGTEARGAKASGRRLAEAFQTNVSSGGGVRCAVGVAALVDRRYYPSVADLMEAAGSAANLARVHGWNHHFLAEPPPGLVSTDEQQEKPEMRRSS